MSKKAVVRQKVLELLDQAVRLIPPKRIGRLPPDPKLCGEQAWHAFEHPLWEIGERIRLLLCEQPTLRSDEELQRRSLAIACDRRAHRGRQGFVMLLGYKACQKHAAELSTQLDDPCVDGHVISTLYKMRAEGFSSSIRPFLDHRKAWIRKEARRYAGWDESV